jgi:hypothetical protein
VPAVLTEEDPARKGPAASEILGAVDPETSVFRKPIFGLTGCPDAMAALAADAVYPLAGARAFGLARLRDLGVELVNRKGVYYDWVGTLEAALALSATTRTLSSR